MNIPTGTKKEDFKKREEIITSFYVGWGRNHLEHRVFNDCLNVFIHVTYSSLDETRRHAAKRSLSTMAVLQLDTILQTAKRVGKPLPIKSGSKNQKNFSKIIKMECQLEGIGKIKLLVGIKKKTGELVQYIASQYLSSNRKTVGVTRGLPYRRFPSNGFSSCKNTTKICFRNTFEEII